jgi:hypothetical protein
MKNFFKIKTWGKWTDIAIGMYSHQYYLLQGRRRCDGKVQFRVEASTICWYGGKLELENLTQLSKPKEE